MDGVLVIDKPSSRTSQGVDIEIRGLGLAEKVGHAGTLDPFATGVLPILLGRAARLSRFLTAAGKTYLATVRFGTETETGDPRGTPLRDGPVPERAAVEAALAGFVGKVSQVPPAFSAKSRGGVRAYRAAAKGTPVEIAPVVVEVAECLLLAWEPPDARLRISCSAGTYVRAIARDLGRAAGSAAHCAALRRVRAGEFGESDAVELAWATSAPPAEVAGRMRPLRSLSLGLPELRVSTRAVTALRHGRPVPEGEIE
ncbi:MAG: tRNA pseudouridine(55) synthase TruB, partial [Planctomycetales bacterium]|nr:tRNA pseudouridine(55) synthase TruB [Planctomycetales bacterium]